MFGLPVTEYPELARTKKELGLLQKLYGLYNAVIDGVNGYYDILWTEVDIEKINNELIDFQNRCQFSFSNLLQLSEPWYVVVLKKVSRYMWKAKMCNRIDF